VFGLSDVNITDTATAAAISAVKIDQGRMVNLNNVKVERSNGAGSAAIELTGSHGIVALNACSSRACSIDIIDNTTSGTVAQSGCTSDSSPQLLGGMSVQNVDISESNNLDWYEEFDTTPTITFGGGSTGITYASQSCRSTRVGRIVYFNIQIGLSSKGTSTGNMVIDGLPTSSLPLASYSCSVRCSGLTGGANEYGLYGVQLINSTTIRVDKGNVGGSVTQLSDADVNDTSTFTVTGHYQVAN
jgi:hypothetical protein